MTAAPQSLQIAIHPDGFRVFPMITWVGAVILMSSAIVPNTPGKTLIAGFIAASMNPLGFFIAKARGIDGAKTGRFPTTGSHLCRRNRRLDAAAQHVRQADAAFPIGGPPPAGGTVA